MSLLHVREAGTRDASRGPVLFVHGFPFDGSMWEPTLAAIPSGWRALAPDLRGFGKSPMATDGDADLPRGRDAGHGVALDHEPVLTMERHADDLAAELERRDAGPAVVCGLSMGGYVALALRRRHPHLVRGLVLADTRAAADPAEGIENRRRMARTARERGPRPIAEAMLPAVLSDRSLRDRPEVVEHVRRMILDTSPATLVAALAGMAARPDATAELPRLDVPTLVAVGEHDSLTPPDTAREMATAIPDARLVVVPAAGHLAPLENPPQFGACLGEFLAEL